MNDKPKSKRKKLTIKQELFAQKYVEHQGNGTQAALEVYDTTDNNTAHSIATENLQKPAVSERVNDLLRRVTDDCIALMDQNKMMQTAISQAHELITRLGNSPLKDDQTTVASARKFLLDAHKTLHSCDNPKQIQHLHAHKLFPERSK